MSFRPKGVVRPGEMHLELERSVLASQPELEGLERLERPNKKIGYIKTYHGLTS